MKIDIDQLNESEPIDLKRRIVERLRFLNQMRAHSSMLAFSIGDKACFAPDNEAPVFGVITRYNKKTSPSWPRMAENGQYPRNFCVKPLMSLSLTQKITFQSDTNDKSHPCVMLV